MAQASRTGLQLLTADKVLLNLGREFILDSVPVRLVQAGETGFGGAPTNGAQGFLQPGSLRPPGGFT